MVLPILLISQVVFAATEFSENFDNMSLPATLEETSCCASVSFATGAAVFPGNGNNERAYLHSLDDDFNTVSFVIEVTVTLADGFSGPGAAFFGLGLGEPLASYYEEPREGPHLFMRVFADDVLDGAVTVVDDNVDIFTSPSGAAGAGTHRLRMNWNAETNVASFQIHQNYEGGDFVASGSYGPFNGNDNGFTPADSRIFFGSASGVSFDDLSVKLIQAEFLFSDGFEEVMADSELIE